jgi:hypothetical protein
MDSGTSRVLSFLRDRGVSSLVNYVICGDIDAGG